MNPSSITPEPLSISPLISEKIEETKENLLIDFNKNTKPKTRKHEKRQLTSNRFVMSKVKTFIKKLKEATFGKDQRFLTNQRRRIIKDDSDIPHVHRARTETRIPQTKSFSFWRKHNEFPVFHPYGKFILFFHLVFWIMAYFLIFWLPVEFGFGEFLPLGMRLFLIILYISGIILKMNTGLVYKERFVELIYNLYMKQYLILDIIALASLAMDPPNKRLSETGIFQDFSTYIYWFLRMMLFLRFAMEEAVRLKVKSLKGKFQINDIKKDINALIYIWLVTYFMLHCFACMWYFIGQNQFDNPDTSYRSSWVQKYGILDESLDVR